ncbi:MAG: hypothetical protein FWD02_01005 [Bacteroidales bacterium]|nr:hypothetical protein [Bacteroidales bacterium]
MKICKFPVALLLIFAMVLTTACESSDSDTRGVELNVAIPVLPDGVEFDGTTLKFEGSGNTVGIDVELQARGRWYALVPTLDDWVTFEHVGNKVLLRVAGNYSGVSRTSRIDFAYQETVKRIYIQQNYVRFISFPAGDTLIIGAGRANTTFPMRTTVAQENLSISVTGPENVYWINPIMVNRNEVTFSTAPNPSLIDSRFATITISGEGASASFELVQKPI